MAHLKCRATRRDPESRLQWKLRKVRGLYERGYSREDILELLRGIDWMLALPEELAKSFDRSLQEFEAEKKMPYITSVERHGIEKGRLRALREAVLDLLEARFKAVPGSLRDQIVAVEDAARLKELHHRAAIVSNIQEFSEGLNRPEGA